MAFIIKVEGLKDKIYLASTDKRSFLCYEENFAAIVI